MSSLPSARRAYWVVLGCLVCQMGLGLAYLFPVVLKDIVAEFQWTRAAFSASGASMLLAMSIASPVIGFLTDRFGARWVITGAVLGLSLSLWLFTGMQSLPQFYAINLLFGFALTGVGDIPVGAVASRWFAKNRGLALALVYIGSNLGGSLAALVGSALREAESWQLAFQVIGVGALVLILPFSLFAVRNPPPNFVAPKPVEPDPEDTAGLTLGQAIRTRTFWILFGLLVIFYFYYLAVNHHLVAFLSDRGFSDARAARNFSAAIFVGIAGKLAIGLLADRIPKRGALILNFALLSLASLLLLAVDLPGALPAFLVLHGFTVAAENVIIPLIVAHCFGLRHMASIYGVLMIALFPGGALGPIFAGYCFDRFGSYELAFTSFAVLNGLALAALFFVRRETDR